MPFKLQWANASGAKEVTVETAQEAVAKYNEVNAGTVLNLTILDSAGNRISYENLVVISRQ